jgi:quercetin dioxygenase-like cupin family protein
MAKCIASANELDSLPKGGLSDLPGIEEIAVIGVPNAKEKIAQGKMNWPHGFHMRRLRIAPGAKIPKHFRSDQEVLIIQDGSVEVCTPEYDFYLNKGDLFSAPRNLQREYRNTTSKEVDIMVIRPGDEPAPAQFTSA